MTDRGDGDESRLAVYLVIAVLGLFLFGACRHVMPIYFGRLRLRNLTAPPPPFARTNHDKTKKEGFVSRTFSYYFGWIPHVLSVDDKTLIATAGLDAFAFLRVCQFGLQLFLPLTVLSVGVLLPIHVRGSDLARQDDAYNLAKNTTDEMGLSGLLLTTVANVTPKLEIFWVHTAVFLVIMWYTTWLLTKHTATFVVLRTLYLTTRGDTNLWRAVHQPSTIIEQLLVQGAHQDAEIDSEELKRFKSVDSDAVAAARDALAAMDEVEDEPARTILADAVNTGKNILTRVAKSVKFKDQQDPLSRAATAPVAPSPRESIDLRRPSADKTPVEKTPETETPMVTTPYLTPGATPTRTPMSRRLTTPPLESMNLAKTLKGAGSLKPTLSLQPQRSMDSDTSEKAVSFRVRHLTPIAAEPQDDGPATPTFGAAPQVDMPSTSRAGGAIPKEERKKKNPGPVAESFQTPGDGINEGFDLSINPPMSEPPTTKKLRLAQMAGFGAMPKSIGKMVPAEEESNTGVHKISSVEDLAKKSLMASVMLRAEAEGGGGDSFDSEDFMSPKTSPRRSKHRRALTREEIKNVGDVALTPAVKRALARVQFLEEAGETVRVGGKGESGVQVRAETAIAHDWWSGIDITNEGADGVRTRRVSRSNSNPNRAPGEQKMSPAPEGIKASPRNLAQAFSAFSNSAIERGEDVDGTELSSPVTRASIQSEGYLYEAPTAVPDVTSARTVNAFDVRTKQIVSVWASSYTVLITDVPFVRGVNEQGEELRVRGLREVESTLEYIFGDEFRGLIPIFDHRPVDALLDSRDNTRNEIAKTLAAIAREGTLPQTTEFKDDKPKFVFGANTHMAAYVKLGYNWDIFEDLFKDVLRPPRGLKKLPLTAQLEVLETQLRAIEAAIVMVRKSSWEGSPGPSCFAVFENQVAASTAAQCVISRATNRVYRAFPAPGPDDVNWQTLLNKTDDNRINAIMVWPIILLIMLFPTGMFATIVTSVCQVESDTNSRYLNSFLSWYCSSEARIYRGLISGVLPPILLTLWEVFVISFYMLYLVQKQNAHTSLSATDRRFLRFYWVWSFINVLVGGIFGGAFRFFTSTFTPSVTFSDLQENFGRVLPLSSNFFLLFIVFRSVYLPVQRLLLPHPGAICMAADIFWCQKRGKCARTARDRTILYSPRAVRMGREIGVFMLVMLLGLTFVCVAPLVSVAAMMFFISNFIIWRYHVLYVYERGYESNGAVWFSITQLVVLSLLISQTFISCVLFSKGAYLQGAVLYITVPYYLFRFYGTLRRKYGGASCWSVPLSEAMAAPPTDFGGEIYTHAALRPAAEGWHPYIGKVWRGYPGVTAKDNSRTRGDSRGFFRQRYKFPDPKTKKEG